MIVFNRYRKETYTAGIDKWIPPGVRMEFPTEAYNEVQLDMDGYDPDHFMEMALIKPGENLNDPHYRRSYVCKVVTRQISQLINLPVLKHHQSAGVTIALKNMSHGMVNNVNRSHLTPTLNACGVFIPSVVSLPVIGEKVCSTFVMVLRPRFMVVLGRDHSMSGNTNRCTLRPTL